VGTLTIAGQAVTVTQAAPAAQACTYAIAPAVQLTDADGGSEKVSVTAGAGCAWTASSHAEWLMVTPPGSGAGNGTVTVGVAKNGGSPRSGTVTIADQTFTVLQAADDR
jgi:hypothetical protein